MSQARVGIIMGSDSDLQVMSDAAVALKELGVAFEMTVVSAHRTPDRLYQYARDAHGRGLRVIIAGAGGAAHLPGMVAAISPLPVIGVPIASTLLATHSCSIAFVRSRLRWLTRCWQRPRKLSKAGTRRRLGQRCFVHLATPRGILSGLRISAADHFSTSS